MIEISLDCLFLVNFCLNYLSIRLCTTILKRKVTDMRKIGVASAVISLIECASCVAPKIFNIYLLTVLGFLTVYFLLSSLISALLYTCFSLWSGVLLTYIMKIFKGVIPMSDALASDLRFDTGKLMAAGSALIVLLLIKYCLGKSQKKVGFANMSISYKDKTATLRALRDSGNLLRDPLSGRSVAILSQNGAKKLGVNDDLLTDPTLRIRVIPIKTVGYTGILYAFIPSSAEIDGKKKSICVALDPQNTDFSGCDAIIPSNI